jgi:hypothetical protein
MTAASVEGTPTAIPTPKAILSLNASFPVLFSGDGVTTGEGLVPMLVVVVELARTLVDVIIVLVVKGAEREVGGIVDIIDVPEGVPQLIPCTQQRGAWLNT